MELVCHLMNGQYDTVGTAGRLRLENSRLTFTLDKAAGTRGSLKWIDKNLGTTDTADRIAADEQVTAFDTSLTGKKIKWPWSFRGRVFKLKDDAGRSWTVSLVTPGGGAMWFLSSGTGVEDEWKMALSEASES